MSEEQPNVFQSDAQDPEQNKKVELSKIIPKSNDSGPAHSSMSAENVWSMKLGERITQSFTKEMLLFFIKIIIVGSKIRTV